MKRPSALASALSPDIFSHGVIYFSEMQSLGSSLEGCWFSTCKALLLISSTSMMSNVTMLFYIEEHLLYEGILMDLTSITIRVYAL